MPRVSVITPAHNSEAYLAEALRSVEAQTFTDWEVVVADDASSDGTVAVAESFAPRVKVVRSETNLGPAGARNLALEHAARRAGGAARRRRLPDAVVPRDAGGGVRRRVRERHARRPRDLQRTHRHAGRHGPGDLTSDLHKIEGELDARARCSSETRCSSARCSRRLIDEVGRVRRRHPRRGGLRPLGADHGTLATKALVTPSRWRVYRRWPGPRHGQPGDRRAQRQHCLREGAPRGRLDAPPPECAARQARADSRGRRDSSPAPHPVPLRARPAPPDACSPSSPDLPRRARESGALAHLGAR